MPHRKGINVGPHNGQWRGDSASHSSIHRFVRKRLSMPEVCEFCKLKPPHDLANITGIYNREFVNWKYFCRPCHMKLDFRTGVRKMVPWNTGKKVGPYSEERVRKSVQMKRKMRDEKTHPQITARRR